MVLKNISKITEHLAASEKILLHNTNKNKKIKALIAQYRQARQAYKQIEFFIEYYSPFDTKFFINGPLVPKVEMEITSVPFQPQGFQVIEELLFDDKKTDLELLKKEYALLIAKLNALKENYTTIVIEENKLQDAMKLQLIRIMCLTLDGYDCTINKESITETAYGIEGLEMVMAFYKDQKENPAARPLYQKLSASLKACRKDLLRHPSSDDFNRLNFMIAFLNPAYQDLLSFCGQLNTAPTPIHYAVNFKAGSFFEANSIRKQYFSVYVTDTFHLKEQAELGRLLFFDPALSGNNKRACASCHQSSKAFTDGLDKSTGFDTGTRLTRNAPTLINAAYQKLFFHDGRIFNLEGQANAVFNNSLEMNSNDKEIADKLKQSSEYRQLFKFAFNGRPDTIISPYAILKCISEFIKTLDSRNSRFDRYLRGDASQLNNSEINGYNLFSGKALCGSCHFFPLFNGTVPPMYNDNEFEVIGTPETVNGKNIDPDMGREKISGSVIHQHAFKTPTLRNIALTAPYMHNGAYNNLDSVLAFYNRGGGAGSGFDVKNQTLPFDSLGLSKKELNDIKQFLTALSDTSHLPGPPNRLPVFSNQALNKRKIGGSY